MGPAIRRAHASTLSEWADNYERNGEEGDREIAFLLRRAVRLLKGEPEPDAGMPVPIVDEPREDAGGSGEGS